MRSTQLAQKNTFLAAAALLLMQNAPGVAGQDSCSDGVTVPPKVATGTTIAGTVAVAALLLYSKYIKKEPIPTSRVLATIGLTVAALFVLGVTAASTTEDAIAETITTFTILSSLSSLYLIGYELGKNDKNASGADGAKRRLLDRTNTSINNDGDLEAQPSARQSASRNTRRGRAKHPTRTYGTDDGGAAAASPAATGRSTADQELIDNLSAEKSTAEQNAQRELGRREGMMIATRVQQSGNSQGFAANGGRTPAQQQAGGASTPALPILPTATYSLI